MSRKPKKPVAGVGGLALFGFRGVGRAREANLPDESQRNREYAKWTPEGLRTLEGVPVTTTVKVFLAAQGAVRGFGSYPKNWALPKAQFILQTFDTLLDADPTRRKSWEEQERA